MAELFANGHFVDLILVVVVLEAAFLIGLWRWKRRGVPPGDFLPNLISGALMLLALRLTLAGGGWQSAIACLSAAGVAHLYDIVRRWRNG
ncbi:hypothetical protein [Rhodopseudomonas palustris]|uniref:Uncharacterized protein n=1 Tax=Rhodopseudomonas palustris (strain BisB18) TaxID=316056 RepID=Q219R8_RHOPB